MDSWRSFNWVLVGIFAAVIGFYWLGMPVLLNAVSPF
jgi:hypothetical protein